MIHGITFLTNTSKGEYFVVIDFAFENALIYLPFLSPILCFSFWMNEQIINLWNHADIKDDDVELSSRTSCGLERYNRHMGTIFPSAHPSLVLFAQSLKNEVDEVIQRIENVKKGREVPPDLRGSHFPPIPPEYDDYCFRVYNVERNSGEEEEEESSDDDAPIFQLHQTYEEPDDSSDDDLPLRQLGSSGKKEKKKKAVVKKKEDASGSKKKKAAAAKKKKEGAKKEGAKKEGATRVRQTASARKLAAAAAAAAKAAGKGKGKKKRG
jgi:hypothetical protein